MPEFQHIQTHDQSRDSAPTQAHKERASGRQDVDLSAEIISQFSRSSSPLMAKLSALKENDSVAFQDVLRSIAQTQGIAFVNQLIEKLSPTAPRKEGAEDPVAAGRKRFQSTIANGSAAFDVFHTSFQKTQDTQISDSVDTQSENILTQAQTASTSKTENNAKDNLDHMQDQDLGMHTSGVECSDQNSSQIQDHAKSVSDTSHIDNEVSDLVLAQETAINEQVSEDKSGENELDLSPEKMKPLSEFNAQIARRIEHSTGVSVSHILVEIDPKLTQQGKKGAARGADWIGLSPEAKEDSEVIAHEAAHNIQASGGSPDMDANSSGTGLSVEEEAIAAAQAIMSGQTFKIVNVVSKDETLFSTGERGRQATAQPSEQSAGPSKIGNIQTSEDLKILQETQSQVWAEESVRTESQLEVAFEEAKACGVMAAPKGLGTIAEFPTAVKVDAMTPAIIPPLMSLTPEEESMLLKASNQTPAAHHAQIQDELSALAADAGTRQSTLIDQSAYYHSVAAGLVESWHTQINVAQGNGLERLDFVYLDAHNLLEGTAQEGQTQIQERYLTEGHAQLLLMHEQHAVKIDTIVSETESLMAIATSSIKDEIMSDLQIFADDLSQTATVASSTIDAKKAELEGLHDWTQYKGYCYEQHEKAGNALSADVNHKMIGAVAKELKDTFKGKINSATINLEGQAAQLAQKSLEQMVSPISTQLDTDTKEIKEDFDTSLGSAQASLETGTQQAQESVTVAHTSGVVMLNESRDQAQSTLLTHGATLTEEVLTMREELLARLQHRADQDAAFYPAVMMDLQAQFAQVTTPIEHKAATAQLEVAWASLDQTYLMQSEQLEIFYTTGEQDMQAEINYKIAVYQEAVEEQCAQVNQVIADAQTHIISAVEELAGSFQGRTMAFATALEIGANPLSKNTESFVDRVKTGLQTFRLQVIKPHLQTIKETLSKEVLKLDQSLKAVAEDKSTAEISTRKSAKREDATALRKAMDGGGTDEDKILKILRNCSPGEIEYLQSAYDHHYAHRNNRGGKQDEDCNYASPLWYDLWDELSEGDLKKAIAYLEHDRQTALKLELEDSVGMFNDDEARIEAVLRSCSDEELKGLHKSTEAQAALAAMGGVDHDVVGALLNTELSQQERLLSADSMRLYEAMDGLGTDDEKVEQILEKCATPAEREMLRAKFQAYSNAQNNGNGESLEAMIQGDFSGADEKLMLAYASVQRSEDMIRVGKLLRAGDGSGTNEKAIFDALEDEKFAAAYAAADKTTRAQMAQDRLALLNTHIKAMSEGEFQSVNTLFDAELGEAGTFTYEDLLAKGSASKEDQANMNLEREVACRTVMTGRCEGDLKLRYAVEGAGTSEAIIKDAISKGGKPLNQDELKKIQETYKKHWGEDAWTWSYPGVEGADETLAGRLNQELTGRDWFDVKILLLGKPVTALDHERIARLTYDFEASGLVGGVFMQGADWVGLTDTHTNLANQYKRFNDLYTALPQSDRLKTITENSGAKLTELAAVAEYVAADAKAYGEVKASVTDALVIALEVIGSVAVTIATAGAATPALVAVLGSIAVGTTGIIVRKAIVGDAYGAGKIAEDFALVLANSALAGAVELKSVGQIADKASESAAKLMGVLSEAASNKGMKYTGKAFELTQQTIDSIGAETLKQGAESTLDEVSQVALNEKTWDHKGLETVVETFAASLPKNFASASVDQGLGGVLGNRASKAGSSAQQALINASSAVTGEVFDARNYQNIKDFGAWVTHLGMKGIESAAHGSMEGGIQRAGLIHQTQKQLENGTLTREQYQAMNHLTDAERAQIDAALGSNDTSTVQLAPNATAADRTAYEARLREGLPTKLKDTPLEADATLPGNEVRVTYDLDDSGRVVNVKIKTGPCATPNDVRLHARTIELIQRYSGFTGQLRRMVDGFKAWISSNPDHPQGTLAWEAKLELDKLPAIVEDRLRQLENTALTDADRTALQQDIERLEAQIEQYRLIENDLSEGRGFVAAAATRTNPEGSNTNCGYCSISHELDARRGTDEPFKNANDLYKETMERLRVDGLTQMLIYPPQKGELPPTPLQYEKIQNNILDYTIDNVARSFGLKVTQMTNVIENFSKTSGYTAEQEKIERVIQIYLRRKNINPDEIDDIVSLAKITISRDHNRPMPEQDDLSTGLNDEIEVDGGMIIVKNFINERIDIVRNHLQTERASLVGSYIIGGPQKPGHFMNMQLHMDGQVTATDYQDGSDPSHREGKEYHGWEEISQRLGGLPELFLYIDK